MHIKVQIGDVLPTDSHRSDKPQGGKTPTARKAGENRGNPIQADELFETINLADSAEEGTAAGEAVGGGEGWAEWEMPMQIREKIDSNPTNEGSKVFHLRRVVSKCKSTCHGVLRDAAGKEQRILGKRKRCGNAVKPGSIQPGYYGEIAWTKDEGVWLTRPSFVWFCRNKACVEKRHQETDEGQPSVPGTWPVAKNTKMSDAEVEDMIQAGFIADMKELNAASDDEATVECIADYDVVPHMRWGRKVQRSNIESKAKKKIATRADVIRARDLLTVVRMLEDGEYSKTWLIVLEDETGCPMHKVTFSEYPECSCNVFQALKSGSKAYHSCEHLKAVLHIKLGIPYANTIIDAPTLSKKEVHDALDINKR